MSDAAILFVKPGAIKPADKKALRGAGVIVVEVDDPQDVKFMCAGMEMPHGDLLACAAKAISDSTLSTGNARELFGGAIAKVLQQAGDKKS